MKLLILVFIFTSFRACWSRNCVCGVRQQTNTILRIFGGLNVETDKYPWIAFLNIGYKSGNNSRCGGSLINDDYILTAAHCLINAAQINVLIGVNDVTKLGHNFLRADTWKSHPDFDEETLNNDIALIRLNRKVYFTENQTPICLPELNSVSSGEFIVAGWGLTETGKVSDKLLEVNVQEYSYAKCKNIWGFNLDARTQICAGNPKKDSCEGDSGGPLMQRNAGKMVIAGIVSYDREDVHCGQSTDAVYTRVEPYLNWIYENTLNSEYCKL